MKHMTQAAALTLAACSLATSAVAAGGRIVIAHDEWTLSNTGFSNAATTGQFAGNVADWFTGGSPGNFLVRTDSFGLAGSSLASTMTAAGHTWTINPTASDSLANLLNYDGVFLCGNPPNLANLTAYVQAGGCVYLAGGTGFGEPTIWDPFLNVFGFDMGSLNGLSASYPISSTHALFQGVATLYHNNGSEITDIAPADPSSQVLIASGSHSLYAVYDSSLSATTYCTAKTNSLGCVPAIGAVGFASATSAPPFEITATNVINLKAGILFYGYSQSISPFQGGFKCMSSPTHRTPIQASNGNAEPAHDCSGSYSFDFNAWIQSGVDPQLVTGQEVDAQYWSRDPASPSTTGLTDAVSFVINA